MPNEDAYGYCRAVKVGDRVLVSGTTATQPGGGVKPEHVGDTYAQAQEALRRIGEVLESFGMSFLHVVKTTVFFTDGTAVGDVVRAHGEVFADVKPASTAVGVSSLFSPDALVEIEVEAVA
jgi:enamine deaminase RidA (YjgF/YER057c/UK114 family)